MKIIHKAFGLLVLIGIILTIGAAGASDLGAEISAIYPYVITGITSLIIGALGIYALEEV